MATGYTREPTGLLNVVGLSDLYTKATIDVTAAIRAERFIPDGGYECPSAKPTGTACIYCKRERGIYPTCDGCGSTEFA